MPRTTLINDDFNRASLGAGWTQLNTGGAGDIRIDSSIRIHAQYTLSSAGSRAGARWAGSEAITADHFSALKLTTISGNSSTDYALGVTGRMGTGTGASRSWYEVIVIGSASGAPYTTEVAVQNGNTRTVLATTTVSWADGDVISAEWQGTTLRAYRNGTIISALSVTDTTLSSSTQGVGVVGSGASTFFGDDFSAGSVTTDTTAPILTSPTGTQTGTTTASGSVSTDEADGTLYRLASTNATEAAATVKAAALTTTVTATGAQAVTFTGLTASTTYYAHYVHRDAAGNDSARVSSASFVTSAASDTTAPTMTGTVTVTPGVTSASALCPTAADNIAVTAYDASIDGGTTWPFTSATPTISITGLTASTAYTGRFRARDAAGNVSTPVLVQAFTTSAGRLLFATSPTDVCRALGGGAVLASAAATMWVHHATSGALIAQLSVSTDSAGLFGTVTHGSLGLSTLYRCDYQFSTGEYGVVYRTTAAT